ncbi:hypothetical protein EAE96_010607 [Botrytis aclada]|nr:hypothetical protein EAE96_010607 [Botrytis aclada]
MRPNAIAAFLGLAILEVSGCHSILNPIACDCINVILNRDVVPAIAPSVPVDISLAIAGPLDMAMRDRLPIRKRSDLLSNANKRDQKRSSRVGNLGLLLLFTKRE